MEANHAVRALGFKPYIAPALSSACLSILSLIRGKPFYGATWTDGVWFGCRTVWTENGPKQLDDLAALPPALAERIRRTLEALKEWEAACRL